MKKLKYALFFCGVTLFNSVLCMDYNRIGTAPKGRRLAMFSQIFHFSCPCNNSSVHNTRNAIIDFIIPQGGYLFPEICMALRDLDLDESNKEAKTNAIVGIRALLKIIPVVGERVDIEQTQRGFVWGKFRFDRLKSLEAVIIECKLIHEGLGKMLRGLHALA